MIERAALERLAALVPLLEDPALQFGKWRAADTRPDGSITISYYQLRPRGLDVVAALPVVEFDWNEWLRTDEGRELIADQSRIANATAEQLMKVTTALVHGDRLTEGTLASAYESGMLLAIARRAAALIAAPPP